MTSDKKYFFDCDLSKIKESIVILDIDGTLGAHNTKTVSEKNRAQITLLLANKNRVYLLSNNSNKIRGKKLAQELGVQWIDTPHRKPSVNVLQTIPRSGAEKIVVIGDKILTDGLFAKRTGATFIHIRSERSHEDPSIVRLQYFLERIVQKFIKL